ncbi:putative reverse transcriptase domain-containing protein [Tanacetum coccineum]
MFVGYRDNTFLMDEAYKLKYSVQPGANKMYYDLRDRYWWPRMKKDIAERRWPLEFSVGDYVLLKVSPWKCVVRFGKKGKLAPRFVGPFEIIEKVGPVAYRLDLPEELNGVHDMFHISNLRKCLADPTLQVPLNEIQVDANVKFYGRAYGNFGNRVFKKLKRSRFGHRPSLVALDLGFYKVYVVDFMKKKFITVSYYYDIEQGSDVVIGWEKISDDTRFGYCDYVLLKVSPWKGVVRFRKEGKLSPRFVGSFEIVEKVGPVAYRLDLPEELNGVHDTFHVSNLKKCLADPTLQVPLDEIRVDAKLNFVEEPVEVLKKEFKKLKRSRIAIVKVR